MFRRVDILALILFNRATKVSLGRTSRTGNEATYEFSHSALAHGRLIAAVDLGKVVTLDGGDVLVHGQVSGWKTSQRTV